jgi:uncharacterized protein (DUF58 family)
MRLFDPGLLRRFHRLWLVSRQLGGSPLLAAPRKKLPAGGTEVSGYRDYAPGDDYRHIYWTWCARRDELLVKVFEGEADRHIYLLLDCSTSMGLGQPPKFQLARQIAAALGYVALLNLDCLSVGAFSDGLTAEVPALRHSSRLPRLLQFLEHLSPGGKRTSLARSAEALTRRPWRPGPCVVLSDLCDPDGFQHGLDLLRHRGYEPRLVHLLDPHEADPGLLGDIELLDVETQLARRVTITERAARRYRDAVAGFRRSVRDYCRRHGIVCMQVNCDAAEDDVLLGVLGGKPPSSFAPPRPTTSAT